MASIVMNAANGVLNNKTKMMKIHVVYYLAEHAAIAIFIAKKKWIMFKVVVFL